MYQGFQRFFESVISMNKRFDAAHQILTGGQGVVSSSLATRTTSEQALYRLLRFFFAKIRAHSRRCASFPSAIRFAGFTGGLEDGI